MIGEQILLGLWIIVFVSACVAFAPFSYQVLSILQFNFIYNLAQISLVYSEHLALPPKSPVKYLASFITAKQAA